MPSGSNWAAWCTGIARATSTTQANRDKLFIHATILGLFFVGGIVGALAFKAMGFSATIPIALLLVAVASPPVIVDFRPGLRVPRDAG